MTGKKTTDKPAESRDQPQGNGDNTMSTEAQDPKAHRDSNTAEQARARVTGETLHAVEIVEKPKPPEPKPPDRNEMEKAADAIENACNGGWTGAGTDKKTIYAILEGKTEAERKVIDEIFREKYGKKYGDKGDGSDWGLEEEFRDEMEGADLDKALNLFWKKDGKADDSGRIHTALVERAQWVEGRSDETCEKDIRDTLATINSKQIEELAKEYRQRYATSLRDALMNDPNLSAATKESVEIYLKGTDKRTADDTLKLADIAIREEDIDMFQEAMRDASPEARKRFIDDGGEKRMKDAFGGVFSDSDLFRAKEYAEKGSLSTATKIRDNTSWSGDNEKAIEQSIAEMTAEQRKAYLDGRNLANGKEAPGLNQEQKALALKTYQDINSALIDAGNENEVAKWGDQIANKGGSLVSRLAAHRGSIYDDSMHDVLSTIEEMPEADWKRLKADPEFRKEIERALGTYFDEDEMKRARAVFDAKQKAETFDEAKSSGRRSVLAAVADNTGTFNNKETNIYDSIEKMTPEEQRRYRDDPEFRKQLDDAVKNALDAGAERDTAFGMLDRVAAGEKPTRGIVEKLNAHAADTDTDEAAVIRDLRKAFADDPALRDRINNPKTPEDHLLSAQFDTALRRALDPSEYERYAKPLLETGHLSLEVQIELNQGTFDDDEQGVYKDALALASEKNPQAQAERQRLLTDQEYQDRVFHYISADERKVALYALEQGKMLPEDVVRSHLLGAGTGETEVKEALAGLNADQVAQLKRDYARKYGEDLTYCLLDEMGGKDATDVKRATRVDPLTAREAFNQSRDDIYQSRDGVGKWWVDNVWDGTGYMTDDAANKFAAAMAKSSAEFKELSPEQQKELRDQAQKSLDLFVESKGAAADMAVDGVIIAAAIAGAKFTGGVSLALLTKTALAGAAFKVAAKSTVMGADYDWASSQVVVDALTGGVDAATIVVGPAQLAQVFKLGEKAAATATTKLLAEGGEQLVKVGAEKQIGKKMFEVVSTAIANGAEGVDDKAIKAIAKEFAKEGQEGALEAALKQNLKEAMEQEARTALKRSLTETTLNMEAGIIGGGTSGGIRGAAEWDTSKSVTENLQMVAQSTLISASMGAGMAGVFTVGFKALGAGAKATYGAFKREVPTIHPDADVVVNGQRLSAAGEPVHLGRAHFEGAPADVSPQHLSMARDEQGRMLILDHSDKGTWVKRAGSDKFERVPTGEVLPVSAGDEVRLGSETGPKLNLETSPKLARASSEAPGPTPRPQPMEGSGPPAMASKPGSAPRGTAAPASVRDVEKPVVGSRSGDVPRAPREVERPGATTRGLDGADNERMIFVGKERLQLEDGRVVIGREMTLPDGRLMIDTDGVSGKHGTLRFDDQHKMFYFEDHSSWGTYVKREGSNDWIVVHNQETRIGPRDEVRLGSPEGPELKRVSFERSSSVKLRSADDVDVVISDQKLTLKNGELKVGRNHELSKGSFMADPRVSREHGTLRFNDADKSFYFKDHSGNGTFVKREGSDKFVEVLNAEIKVGPNDEIRLGSPDGPQLQLFARGKREIAEGLHQVEPRFNFDGKPAMFDDQGRLVVGRGSLDNADDLLNQRVSPDHGVVTWDQASKHYVYEDTSASGTWIKVEGSDDFIRIRPGDKAVLTPNTVLRLGSENGPELKLTQSRGQVLEDGSMLFRKPDGDTWRTKDGTSAFSDRAGIQRWEGADGRITDVTDPTGIARNYGYAADGSLNKVSFSSRMTWESSDGLNWSITNPDGSKGWYKGKVEVMPDGSLKFNDGVNPPEVRRLDGTREILHANGRVEYRDANIQVDRTRLEQLADYHLGNPDQKARLSEFARSFEQRAMARGLPPEEVALTYHHINRLINAGAEAPLSKAERVRLAEQLLQQAANPNSIDQGLNNSCNVTTVENRIFHRSPSEAVRLVTDVATTGKYTTNVGTVIDMGRIPGALKPDGEAMLSYSRAFDPFSHQDIRLDGRRTWASQIFQTTAANVHWVNSPEFKLNPGDMVVYEKPFGAVPGSKDTGERLYKYTMTAEGKLEKIELQQSPHISDYELTSVHAQITGRNDQSFVIRGPDHGGQWFPGEAVQVKSAQELQEQLLRMHNQSDFPAILMVDARREPFRQFISNPDAGGGGGLHVINVQGLLHDPKTGQYYVEFTNQWGSQANRMGREAIPLEELFEATRPYNEIEALVSSPARPGTTGTVRPRISDLEPLPRPEAPAVAATPDAVAASRQLDNLSGNHKFREHFAPPENIQQSLDNLRTDLVEVPVKGADGQLTNVYQKIMDEPTLTGPQKDRIMRMLAEVHDAYLRIDDALPEGAPNKGYQIVNWKHTRGEIDQVLEAAKLNKLNPEETEDAIMISIFADSIKTPQNFITHNIDGAQGAADVLARYFDPAIPGNLERINGITQAIKEHQIGPPGFMAKITRGMLLSKLGGPATADQTALIDSICKRIANPLDTAHHTADGTRIEFSPDELVMLKKIGVEEWTVPHPGSPWYKASRAVIDGDSLINYASPDGWAKIAAIRGPGKGPFFEDPTIWRSLQSAKESYDDALTVMTNEAKPLAEAGLDRTNKAVERVKPDVDAWLAKEAGDVPYNPDGSLPFWNADLKYPEKLTQQEQQRFTQLFTSESAGLIDAAQRAELQGLRYKGLTPLQIQQFEFAKKLREKTVELLRAQQGIY